jgi:hypothetical protein
LVTKQQIKKKKRSLQVLESRLTWHSYLKEEVIKTNAKSCTKVAALASTIQDDITSVKLRAGGICGMYNGCVKLRPLRVKVTSKKYVEKDNDSFEDSDKESVDSEHSGDTELEDVFTA